jgi:hypothetical protein
MCATAKLPLTEQTATIVQCTSLKYKEKASINGGEIDWRKICKEDEQCKLYINYLLEITTRNMTYDNFCEAVVHAGQETAISIE